MSCDLCKNGNMVGVCCCPACGYCCDPASHGPSWEERLDGRRHKGSHMTALQENTAPPPIKQGTYRVHTQAMRGAVKYSRAWNSGYDGPGKGTN